ncbi:family 10 glycosylhydrolase [Hamadaea sp. NPDC050747]|uniref:glycoside hydrolase family 10 protein n=1 Tax=Hamadaea sp. NPDC050747 TaxID=3155789 RepID=UPI0033F55C9A
MRARWVFAATALALVASLGLWAAADVSRPGRAIGEQAAGAAANRNACGQSAPRELRGMWLTTVRNIDWPSRPGLPEATVKAEYQQWLDLAVKMNHNAIFVHVRPSGDAFWPSEYAPFSYWLTGDKTGRNPGWDPLDYAVTEAHKRGLEFHAWFNPYKASQDPVVPAGYPHPEWTVTYPLKAEERHAYFDPGIPAARQWVEDSILESVRKYDLDGVHFDDFFYPYPKTGQEFPDQASYAQFGGGKNKNDWRRDNVNLLVRETYERIKQIKPWVRFGISPFGIWRNDDSDRRGSATQGLESYAAIYADTRTWVKEGWLDYIVPQLYWHIGFKIADYAVLLRWWTELVKGTDVQLYIGQADYRINNAGVWKDPAELDRQIALNQKSGVLGSIHFSAKSVRTNKLGAVTRYRDAHNATPALIPVSARLKADPPLAPTLVVRRTTEKTAVTWRPTEAGPPAYRYAVYRDGVLVATVPGGTHSWQDAKTGGSYCVTALDRSWNESRA